MKRPHGMILPYTVRLFLTCRAIFICYIYMLSLLLYLHAVFTVVISAVVPPVHFLINMLVYYKLYLQLL